MIEIGLTAALVFILSTLACGLTISVARSSKFGTDESSGVQKMHQHWVPRLGGVPVFIGAVTGFLVISWEEQSFLPESVYLVVCLLPAFAIGLIEDITRRAGVLPRLVFTMIAAALGWWLLGACLRRLNIPVVDEWLVASGTLAFCLTLIAAAGVAHATNIIDGFNGLCAVTSIIAFLAIGIVAHQLNDLFICSIAWIAAGSVAGFLVWNFPHGRIFLGDAGAYLIGFLLAELAILLVARHPTVSPWFPLLLLIYPVWETLFSAWRRASAHSIAHVGRPDALHLHHLVYRRLSGVLERAGGLLTPVQRNSVSSAMLWILVGLCAIPAVLCYDQPQMLQFFCGVFVTSYLLLYRMLVRSRKFFRAATSRIVTMRVSDEECPEDGSESAV